MAVKSSITRIAGHRNERTGHGSEGVAADIQFVHTVHLGNEGRCKDQCDDQRDVDGPGEHAEQVFVTKNMGGVKGTHTDHGTMRVQNEIDRFHLVKDVLLHLPQLGNRGAYLIQQMNDKLVAHKNYIHEIGQDMPEILDWKWHLPENK